MQELTSQRKQPNEDDRSRAKIMTKTTNTTTKRLNTTRIRWPGGGTQQRANAVRLTNTANSNDTTSGGKLGSKITTNQKQFTTKWLRTLVVFDQHYQPRCNLYTALQQQQTIQGITELIRNQRKQTTQETKKYTNKITAQQTHTER